jgi:hypothetical protein
MLEFPSMSDHHPSWCPECGVECAFIGWKERIIMFVPKNAPGRFSEAMKWFQQEFDELDFVEFVCALEELAYAMQGHEIND